MDKPFSMIYEEFKQNLADIINNAGMPPAIIETVLQNCLCEINTVVKAQYARDKAQYENSLLEKEKKDEQKKN